MKKPTETDPIRQREEALWACKRLLNGLSTMQLHQAQLLLRAFREQERGKKKNG